MPHSHVAILGGGISGLVVAHRLSQILPKTSRITVLEASNRCGGWLHSQQHAVSTIDVSGKKMNTSLVLEKGPRTMRPRGKEGWTAVQLADELGLTEQIVTTKTNAASAKKRYIYYPDQLNHLPHSLLSLATSLRQPALQGFLPALLTEAFRSKSPAALDSADESVDSFVRRRLGPRVADNLISAMIHGIYAGDAKHLSVRAIFPSLWRMEQSRGSLTAGLCLSAYSDETKRSKEAVERIQATLKQETRNKLRGASVWSLKGGFQGLADSLVERLRQTDNVDLVSNAEVQSIDVQQQQIKLDYRPNASSKQNKAAKPATLSASHLVCALPSRALHRLLPALPHLTASPSVDVGLVNLVYRNPPPVSPKQPRRVLPVSGFGYLIPQSTPPDRNPHRVLGVIFDSDVMPQVDESVKEYTKLTVMMGGHYYNGLDPKQLPGPQELVQQAQETLAAHLDIRQEPVFAQGQMQRHCIPQYGVGHVERMAELDEALRTATPQVSLAGASYTGVSVNDCIYHARALADRIARGSETATGLESYLESMR